MKKQFFTLTICLLSFVAFAQYTAIPDSNFENALNAYDDIYGDGQVPTANINSITDLDVSDENITDLTGIEDFIALTELDCSENQLTSLNITQLVNLLVLYCSENQIANLDVTQNYSLINLSCYENQLTSLDVTQNLNLLYLACAFNQLATLDVTQNNNLIGLMCGNSQLANFNLTQNYNLEVLYCYTSPLVTALDLSFNTNLTDLRITYGGLGISNLDLSQNINLENIRIEECSNLTSLDLSSNVNLQYVTCSYNNSLVSLNINNGNNSNIFYSSNVDNLGYQFYATNNLNLTCIEVDDADWSTNNWTNIDSWASFSEDCPDLTYVPDNNFENYLETHDANGNTVTVGDPTSMGNGIANDDYVITANINTVTNLDVSYLSISDLTGISDFTTLTHLACHHNNLSTLNISQNTGLVELTCGTNQITSLDVTQNTSLTLLYCYDNLLTTLDVSQNIALIDFRCYDNSLASLDVTANTNLVTFECGLNSLTSLNVKNGNNTNIVGFNTINNPNLTCILVDDATWSIANWTYIDPTSTFVNSQAECNTLSIADVNFKKNINIYPNPTKNTVTIKTDKLSKYKIYSITGKILKKGVLFEGKNFLDITNINKGMYFIKISDDNSKIIKKLIIK